jgi:hypothetical protein
MAPVTRVVTFVRSGLGWYQDLCIDVLNAVAGAVAHAAEGVIGAVDLDGILEHLDIDAIVQRIDIDAILQRVDIDGIVGRIDLDALIDRVDLDHVIGGVDVAALVEQTDLGAVIAQSTGGIASGAVDLVRRQGVGLDGVVEGWVAHIRRRRNGAAPTGPPQLARGQEP